MLYTGGEVAGIKTDVSFDCGATASIVSKRLVEANRDKIVVRSSGLKIKTATNEIQQVLGITDEL